MAKLDDEELVDLLTQAASDAIGPHTGELEEDTERVFDYYMGKQYGDEVDNRSKFVTREVFEVVEGIMPYLVEVFFSSDQAAVFEPEDDDDVLGAEQETEYVNSVFYRQNPGFKIGYTWLKDGLLNKLAVVKAVREGSFGVKTRKYKNLTDVQVSGVLADMDEDQTEELNIEQLDDGLFNIDFSVNEEDNKTVIYNVPPENFRISDTRSSIADAYYTGEFYQKSISELREMGYDVDDDISDSLEEKTFDSVAASRIEGVDTEIPNNGPTRGNNPAAREVEVAEEYMFVDADGDGLTELVKTVRVGHTLLFKEVATARPYFGWSSVIVPHRVHGMAAADPIMALQHLRSRLIRNILDNQWLQNNGRYAVVDGEVNMDDLLVSSAHGVVRENFAGAVRELPTPELGRGSFEVLGYTDTLIERRSGVSDRTTGIDPKQFNSNTAATTADLVMSAAEQKLRLIARIFAECGLKELFMGIHRIGMMFEKPGVKMRNNDGKFIELNPEQWKDRTDMTVTVGIGNSSKTQQAMIMGQLLQTQQAVVSGGGLGTLITPTNVYNLAIDQAKALGRKDASRYFTKPESDDIPDQGPSIEDQVKISELQLKQEEAAAKIETDKIQLELDAAELVLKEERLEFEKAELAFKQQQHEDENEFKLLEAQLEIRQGPTKLGND